MDQRLRVDPTEVADVRWLTADRLLGDLTDNPDRYAPWLGGVLAVATGTGGSGPPASAH